MEKVIDISKEAKFDIKVVAGKLVLAVSYDGAQVDAGISVAIDSDAFLDKLAALIPGQLDDLVISGVKVALKAL